MAGLSRRALLGRASALGLAGWLGGGGVAEADPAARAATAATASTASNAESAATADSAATAAAAPGRSLTASVAPFSGGHQAGIATPRPASIVLAAFDLRAQSAGEVAGLLRGWTIAVRALAAGRPAPGADSGETAGLPPAALTLTVGFGPGLFDRRYGLASERPAALDGLPAFPDERIDPALSNGDLVVQACAQEPSVAMHAVRQLVRLGAGAARLRWLTTGFVPPAAELAGATPRNLLGFKDGTANPRPGSDAFDTTVWVAPAAGPAWLVGGTYLCFRKVRIDLAAWDRLTVADQQTVIGRVKRSGAPLSGGGEHAPIDLRARRPDGRLAIPPRSHVRLAAPQENGGARLFRRSFAFADAARGGGELDAGQLFIAFAANPDTQFIPVLAKLAQSDRLARFTTHVATGLWAVPPAPHAAGWLGESLLG